MKPKVDYRLYLCTDRRYLHNLPLQKAVELAIEGGCSIVQLREKQAASRDIYELAKEVKKVTDYFGIPLIINDRLDIALAVDASGVHLGQSDLPVTAARRILGEDKIIGVTAPAVSLALQAEADGADYIGAGALFPTSTKDNAKPLTPEALKAIKQSITIPVVAIGGLNADNLQCLTGCGIDGAAVSSAVMGASDIRLAAKKLRKQVMKL